MMANATPRTDPGAPTADLSDLTERSGRDWQTIPNRLRSLITATVLNPQSSTDGILLLADALAELADEVFDPHLIAACTHVADHLRSIAPRRA